MDDDGLGSVPIYGQKLSPSAHMWVGCWTTKVKGEDVSAGSFLRVGGVEGRKEGRKEQVFPS